ncbi:Uncharacterized protein Fot_48047 [Forsythia ovata]|uniref:Uncharacterized protein n=1 Tax=Forsythia ovata TaxID=205694 RepID=A0ABD1QU22_9LAMI
MELSSIIIIVLSCLAFSAIQARILLGDDQFMAKTIGDQRPLNPLPPPSLREAPPLSSSFLFSEELMENLRQWFITVANSGRLKPSFSDGNSCNKHESIAGVGRDPKPAPPSPKPAPGTRWKLPSPITTTGVGRDPKPAPPSPKPASGTRWKLPSPITTTGVGRDPEPAPPSPKPSPGTRWKLPSPITTTGVGRDPKPALGTRWKLTSFSTWKTRQDATL